MTEHMMPNWLGYGEFATSSGGDSNLTRRRVRAPDQDEDWAEEARLHELMRVALNPAGEAPPPGLDPDILKAISDLRINGAIAEQVYHQNLAYFNNKVPSRFSMDELEYANEIMKIRKDVRANTLRYISSIYRTEAAVVANLGDFNHDALTVALNRLPRTWKDVLEVAQNVQKIFEMAEQEQPPPPSSGLGGRGGGGEDGEEKNDESLRGFSLGHLADQYDDFREAARALEHKFPNSEAPWGKLEIEYPPLSEEHPSRNAARKIKPRDYGDSLRFIDRDVTDGRVFGSIRQVKGGTILVDNSGSMNLTAEHIISVIAAAPFAKIAIYEGLAGNTKGKLQIVAEHGRMAHPRHLERVYGSNIVDGPCLDWLALQKRPRLWVSDGKVTATGESQTDKILADASLKMLRGRIRRVGNVPSAVRFLTKGGFR